MATTAGDAPVVVRHLNCGTLRPLGGRMVCHCLLVETGRGLALVDTGFGLGDVADPPRGPRSIEAFQRRFQVDGPARHRNRERLRELAAAHGDRVAIFCSHDPVELERFSRTARPRAGELA